MKLSLCIAVLGMLLFVYLGKQNEMTQLKMQLPHLEKQIASIQEENRRLRYEVDQFEHPNHLIELAHRPEFGHLKYPLFKEILTVPDALAANE